MRVLYVVHRVFSALGFGEIQIKVQMLVALSKYIEKSGGFVPDLMAQFAQRHEFAGTGGHRDLLAVAVERRELDERYGKPFRRNTERRKRTLDARDVAVMIGTPHVNHKRVAAIDFIEMVGDVGGK